MTPRTVEKAPEDAEYFLSVLDELRGLTGLRATAYQAIRAAGLLRILLTDPPLVHKIVRLTGLRPTYEATVMMQVRTDRKLGPMRTTGVLIDPEIAGLVRFRELGEVGRPHQLNLDGLLGMEVMSHSDRPAYVRDLVRLYANKMGGAHREHSGHTADSAALTAALPEWEPVLRQSLLGVARVVLRALRPLELELCLADEPGMFGLDLSTMWRPPEK